jgi:DNA-binding transcriptional LysR family regulator
MNRANGLLAVELRHLAALEAVVEEGSFARAARRLGYTQSALSQQLSALERAVGTQLIERRTGRKPLGPTAAGALLLGHAERIVASLRAAEADLASLAAGEAGTLSVGTFQSVGMSVIPELLARFGRRWPQVDVALDETVATEELLRRIEHGELDLTFTVLPLDDGPFDSLELLTDPYVLLAPAGSPLADRAEPITVADVEGLPLAAWKYAGRNSPEAQLRGLGVNPRVIFRSDETATVHGLVAAGVACAVLPQLAVNRADSRIRALPLPFMPPRRIAMTWHAERHRTAASHAFVAIAREVCAELGAI